MFGAEFSFTLRSENSLLTDPEKSIESFRNLLSRKNFTIIVGPVAAAAKQVRLFFAGEKKIATWSSVGNFIFLPGTRFSIQELNSNVRPKIATLVAKGPTYFASSKGD